MKGAAIAIVISPIPMMVPRQKIARYKVAHSGWGIALSTSKAIAALPASP